MTLNDEFEFDLDAAATPENAKCDRHLTQALGPKPWPGDRVFLNPPYDRGLLVRFLDRAVRESESGKVVVVILPVRSDTDWWADQVVAKASEIRFIRRRVAFVPPPNHAVGRELSNRPMYASAVVVYGPGARTGASAAVSTMQGRSVRSQDWMPAEQGQLEIWDTQA